MNSKKLKLYKTAINKVDELIEVVENLNAKVDDMFSGFFDQIDALNARFDELFDDEEED